MSLFMRANTFIQIITHQSFSVDLFVEIYVRHQKLSFRITSARFVQIQKFSLKIQFLGLHGLPSICDQLLLSICCKQYF